MTPLFTVLAVATLAAAALQDTAIACGLFAALLISVVLPAFKPKP